MPTWVDSPEDPGPRILQAVSSPIPGRKPPIVYDLTEVDSEEGPKKKRRKKENCGGRDEKKTREDTQREKTK